MDELARRHLQAVDNFIASLTPQQQRLLKIGALTIKQCTPHQQRLAEEMDHTAPQGLTPGQMAEYTRQLTLEENRERFEEGFRRGCEEGDRQANQLKWTAFAIGCCIAILILLSHC